MKAENARISAVRLYLHYISIHIRSAMQYKTSFFWRHLASFYFHLMCLWELHSCFNDSTRWKVLPIVKYWFAMHLFWLSFHWQKCLQEALTHFLNGAPCRVWSSPCKTTQRNLAGIRKQIWIIKNRKKLSSNYLVYLWRYARTNWLEFAADLDCDFHADRWGSSFFRIVHGVCSTLLFHTGWTRIYECVNRWCKRIWQISDWNLRKAYATVLYRDCSVCADSILSAFIFARKNYFSLKHGDATICCYF